MEASKRDLWANLARTWRAQTQLRTELFSGRDVLRRQRKKGNYALTVCQELTPGPDQYVTWIGVEPTKDCAIEPGSPIIWSGLSGYDYILSIGREGDIEIGKVSLISGMPTDLYQAWQDTDRFLNGRLTELLEAKSRGLSEKLRPI